MSNWLEMTPQDFGHTRTPRQHVTDAEIRALYAHAKRERKAREAREAAAKR